MLAAPSYYRSLYNAHYSQLVHILQQTLNCLHQLVLMTFMYASAVVANGETIHYSNPLLSVLLQLTLWSYPPTLYSIQACRFVNMFTPSHNHGQMAC